MTRRVQVAIDCHDPERLAGFWCEVLGYRARPAAGHGSWAELSRAEAADPDEAWAAIEDPAGEDPPLFFHRVPEPKTVKNRVHLDIRVAPGAPTRTARPLVDAEVERLVALGAAHLRGARRLLRGHAGSGRQRVLRRLTTSERRCA